MRLFIVGNARECELVEYVQDPVVSGLKKALIVMNHVVSEPSGMKYCAEWSKPIVPEVAGGVCGKHRAVLGGRNTLSARQLG